MQQNMKQFQDAHDMVYGAMGDQSLSPEQIGRAAAFEAMRKLKDSGQRMEPGRVKQQLQRLAEAEAERVVQDRRLEQIDIEQVKKQAVKAAGQLAPQAVGA